MQECFFAKDHFCESSKEVKGKHIEEHVHEIDVREAICEKCVETSSIDCVKREGEVIVKELLADKIGIPS